MTDAKMKIHVKHILVQHKYMAEDILRKLKEGVAFSQLAEKNSICSSSRVGGDLGLVSTNQLDSDFAEALENLKPGEMSPPVRTKFGYHLIFRVPPE